MICLGIESTAHTWSIGIVTDDGKILANAKDVFTTQSGGLIPNELAKHHERVKDEVLKKALEQAKINLKDVNLIAFSQAPGLAPALLVGLNFAKELSSKLKVPLIGVNHCCAHLEIGRLLTKAKDPVLLYASGANTQIIAYEGGKYRIFGETVDNGIGNFLDSFARHIGLGFPGGPKIEQLALKGKNLVELPYNVKGMDVAFSGMLTKLQQLFDSKKYSAEDLAFSSQETAFAMLVEVSERAMAHTDKTELLIGGGVGCNKRLQEMCTIMCKERGAKFYAPPNEYLTDNAAMICWTGLLMHKAGVKTKTLDILPHQRTDQVEVTWR